MFRVILPPPTRTVLLCIFLSFHFLLSFLMVLLLPMVFFSASRCLEGSLLFPLLIVAAAVVSLGIVQRYYLVPVCTVSLFISSFFILCDLFYLFCCCNCPVWRVLSFPSRGLVVLFQFPSSASVHSSINRPIVSGSWSSCCISLGSLSLLFRLSPWAGSSFSFLLVLLASFFVWFSCGDIFSFVILLHCSLFGCACACFPFGGFSLRHHLFSFLRGYLLCVLSDWHFPLAFLLGPFVLQSSRGRP